MDARVEPAHDNRVSQLPSNLLRESAMPKAPPLRLGVNVDHVATLRNARAGRNPDPVRVSLFIAADPRQIEMAAKLRAPVIEIHTGAWCDAVVDGHAAKAETEWQRIVAGAGLARSAGLEVHAGHGLDYVTAEKIAGLPEIVELNIGYYMIGEALFVGLS